MSFYIITELQIQYMHDLFLNLLIFHRENNLHPAVKITRHPVRTSHIDFIISAIFEIENTAVLQKFSNNRTHMDILTDTWCTFQTADTPDQQIDLYSAGRCIIKRRNDSGSHREFIFAVIRAGLPFLRMFCFPFNQLQKTVLHPDWCNDQTIPVLRLRISGKHVKYSRCIFSKTFITGKNTTVCI